MTNHTHKKVHACHISNIIIMIGFSSVLNSLLNCTEAG